MPNGFISKPTRRELQEQLAHSSGGDPRIRGRVRNLEEGEAIARRLELEGEAFTKPFLVRADAPESVQARIDTAKFINPSDPESIQEQM